MSDYIKREDATEVYSKLYWMHEGLLNFQEELGKVYDEIISIPSADVAPVRHGKYIGTEFDGYADGCPVYYEWKCSECGCVFEEEEPTYNYCPNCGARMDGESDE